MKVAVPVANGRLSAHFGHCERLALFDVDRNTKQIISQQEVEAPAHQPGFLQEWLAERKVTVVISSGIGVRAQRVLAERRIDMVVGAPAGSPENLVREYLAGTLQTGRNISDH